MEIGRDVPQSVYLDGGVKLLVVQDRHSFGENLIEFEIDANAAVPEESCVTVRGTTVGCGIKDEHEAFFHEQVGRDLNARVSVVYTKTAEERLIGHRASFYTRSVQS